jgi:hypothetical protein
MQYVQLLWAGALEFHDKRMWPKHFMPEDEQAASCGGWKLDLNRNAFLSGDWHYGMSA